MNSSVRVGSLGPLTVLQDDMAIVVVQVAPAAASEVAA